VPHRPKTAWHRQIILDQITAHGKNGCWIWSGTLMGLAQRPYQSFAETFQLAAYAVPVTTFMYEKANNVTLPPRTPFHFCLLEPNRCVSPLHNYPAGDCHCERCSTRRVGRPGPRNTTDTSSEPPPPKPKRDRSREKPRHQNNWIYRYEDAKGNVTQAVLHTRSKAETYALAHILTLYGTTDIAAAQEQHGFKWEIIKEPVQ
jgi:hypothetical protein